MTIWKGRSIELTSLVHCRRRAFKRAELHQKQSQEHDEGQPRPKYIFNKCGTNIYFFTLQRSMVHHNHRILNKELNKTHIIMYLPKIHIWNSIFKNQVIFSKVQNFQKKYTCNNYQFRTLLDKHWCLKGLEV